MARSKATERAVRIHRDTGQRVEMTIEEIEKSRASTNDCAKRNKTRYFNDIYVIEFYKAGSVVEPKADEKQPETEQEEEK